MPRDENEDDTCCLYWLAGREIEIYTSQPSVCASIGTEEENSDGHGPMRVEHSDIMLHCRMFVFQPHEGDDLAGECPVLSGGNSQRHDCRHSHISGL